MGQPLDAQVEFGVGERGVLEDDGRGGGGAPGLGAEQFGQGGRGHGTARVVELGEDPGAFVVAQHVEGADTASGIGGDVFQQRFQPRGECLDGRAVEEVGAVLDPPLDAGARALLDEVEAEVELGGVLPHGLAAGGEPRQGGLLARSGEVDDHHLEQRVPGQGAFGAQRLHQPLEGQLLVLVGGQVGVPDAGEQFGEGGVAGQIGAQYEGVDEEADQVLQGLVAASGDGGAEGDVLAGAEPVQQGGHGGLGDHEHADAVVAGEGAQGALQAGRDGEADGAAAPARLGGARPVGGQVQFGREAGEGVGPVGQQRVTGLLQHLVLPEGVVGVVGGQRRPLGGAAGRAGRVGGGEVGEQRPVGPFVGGDVVQDEQEDVLPRHVRLEQGRPQREFTREVEGAGGLRGEVRAGWGAQGDAGLGRVQDVLVRHPVRRREHGTQRCVPGDDVVQGGFKRGPVEVAGEPPRGREVVRRARPFHLVQQPQPVLGRGQGQPLGARAAVPRAGRPGTRPASSRAASRATVDASKTDRTVSSAPSAVRTRPASRMASSE